MDTGSCLGDLWPDFLYKRLYGDPALLRYSDDGILRADLTASSVEVLGELVAYTDLCGVASLFCSGAGDEADA